MIVIPYSATFMPILTEMTSLGDCSLSIAKTVSIDMGILIFTNLDSLNNNIE
jgi:hypothetical protein